MSNWLIPLNSVTHAELTLICVPYAGGNAHVYRPWSSFVAPGVALYGVELPGRGTRFSEARSEQLSRVAADVGRAVMQLGNRPFALFGHSMGALIAFETALWLERKQFGPQAVCVSGRAAAHSPRRHELMHRLETSALQARLEQYGGLPQLLLETPALWRVYEPILRADFALCENHEHSGEVLNCPLQVLCAEDDRTLEFADVQRWSELTRGSCEFHKFTGGHFFIRSNEGDVVRTLMHQLTTQFPFLGEGRKDGQRANRTATAAEDSNAGNGA